jgi:hypothetical protein
VRDIIIALEVDRNLRSALSIVPALSFLRYTISFSLEKA